LHRLKVDSDTIAGRPLDSCDEGVASDGVCEVGILSLFPVCEQSVRPTDVVGLAVVGNLDALIIKEDLEVGQLQSKGGQLGRRGCGRGARRTCMWPISALTTIVPLSPRISQRKSKPPCSAYPLAPLYWTTMTAPPWS